MFVTNTQLLLNHPITSIFNSTVVTVVFLCRYYYCVGQLQVCFGCNRVMNWVGRLLIIIMVEEGRLLYCCRCY